MTPSIRGNQRRERRAAIAEFAMLPALSVALLVAVSLATDGIVSVPPSLYWYDVACVAATLVLGSALVARVAREVALTMAERARERGRRAA